jgi:hypothetical protein
MGDLDATVLRVRDEHVIGCIDDEAFRIRESPDRLAVATPPSEVCTGRVEFLDAEPVVVGAPAPA